MKRKVILILMTIIFLGMFIYSLIHILIWAKDNKHTSEVIDDVQQFKNVEKKEEKIEETEDNTSEEEEEVFIDFEELKKKNKDVKGWIKVKGTNIDYPFVQTSNNSYYLTHSYDKKYTDAGWVFMDYRNEFPSDQNTVLYAHDRKDNTMFGTLKTTMKKNWWDNEDNHIITVYTENETLYYKVFSSYHIKTEEYYITPNFDKDEYLKFLKTIKKRSINKYDIDLDENSQILTLSTCYTKTQKVVLHAVLIRD